MPHVRSANDIPGSIASRYEHPSERQPAGSQSGDYRSDIDGLRALAILLVVAYHVWLGRVSGGVDVFLMISAFFLTSSLTRRVERGSRLQLGRFWLRRFRRLLPAAAVTLIGVLVAAYAFFPSTDWVDIWNQTWASLFYVQNWALAFGEVDYYAQAGAVPSPLQHFWSLSVQGQVFILWPVIIWVVALLLGSRTERARTWLFTVFAGVFAVSLWFSIIETATSQQFAYFDTRTRLWEFAAGSLVALVLPKLRIGRVTRAILGWAGVVGIVACGIVLDVRGGFPGYFALWPVLCTAAVIVSGHGDSRGGPMHLLTAKPLRFIGRDAYALYLVHWPVLITSMTLAGSEHVSLKQGAIIILLSMIIARLLSWAVEHPLQRSRWIEARPWRGVALIALCLALVASCVGAWQRYEARRTADIMADSSQGYPGAAQVDSWRDITDSSKPLIPTATELNREWESIGEPCSGELEIANSELDGGYCQQSPDALDAEKLVVVIGDSHAQQLSAPLAALANEHDIGVVGLLKGGCTIGLGEEDRGVNEVSCSEWMPKAIDFTIGLEPDAVYVVATRASDTEDEKLLAGATNTIDRFRDEGITVMAVRDNPRFAFNMYDCVVERGSEACAIPRSDALDTQNPISELRDVVSVDFTPWLCPEARCEGAIGNVAVYMDDNHLTATYGRTLAPMLEQIMQRAGILPVPSEPQRSDGV